MRTIPFFLLLGPLAVACNHAGIPDAEAADAEATGPVIRITAVYPTATAKTVADTVAAPIEEQINGVEGMTIMESESRSDGTYTLTVRFKPKTDMKMALVLIQNRVSLALPVVPAICQREGVTIRKAQFDRLPSLWLAVTCPGGKYDAVFLGNLVVKIGLRDELGRVPGVLDVRVIGGPDATLRVWLDPEKLAARDLKSTDVIEALEKQNLKVAAGQIGKPPAREKQEFPLTINSLGRLVDADDLGNVVLKAAPAGGGNGIVRLMDVARVESGAKAEGFATLNGKPSVLLALESSDNKTADAVLKAIGSLEDKMPRGVQAELISDLNGSGSALVELRLPDSASWERTQETVARAEKVTRLLPGVAKCLSFGEREANVGTFLVKLTAKDAATPADIRKALTKQIPTAVTRVSDLSAGVPFPVRIALADTGDHGEKKLRAWAESVAKKLADDGVVLDPGVLPGRSGPRLALQIDRTKAKALGVAQSDLFEMLQAFAGKESVSAFDEFGRNWLVTLQAGKLRMTAEDLMKLQIRNDAGQMVRFGIIASAQELSGASSLYRVDLYPAMKITAAVPPGKTLAEVTAKCLKIAEAELPGKGYKVIDLTTANPR